MNDLPFQQELNKAEIEFDKQIRDGLKAQILRHHHSIATAEALTGGLLGHYFQTLVGTYYMGGIICPSTLLKVSLGAVSPKTIQSTTEHSAQVATELAQSIHQQSKSHIAIANTGIPQLQEYQGDVYECRTHICIWMSGKARVKQLMITGSPDEIRQKCVQSTGLLLKQCLENQGGN